MRPFFSYYGGKWRAARHYPPPNAGRLVVEPFAGSAGYSVYYEPRKALLIDAYEPIVGVWDYLIHVSESEFLDLPDLEKGVSVDELCIPQEARWLIGFWINRATASPGKRITGFSDPSRKWDRSGQVNWNAVTRTKLSKQLEMIRKWEVRLGSYDTAPDVEATWFVDPPYQHVKRKYRVKFAEYDALGRWCQERRGLVIACDQSGADWLDFKRLRDVRSMAGRQKASSVTSEVVWIKS